MSRDQTLASCLRVEERAKYSHKPAYRFVYLPRLVIRVIRHVSPTTITRNEWRYSAALALTELFDAVMSTKEGSVAFELEENSSRTPEKLIYLLYNSLRLSPFVPVEDAQGRHIAGHHSCSSMMKFLLTMTESVPTVRSTLSRCSIARLEAIVEALGISIYCYCEEWPARYTFCRLKYLYLH